MEEYAADDEELPEVEPLDVCGADPLHAAKAKPNDATAIIDLTFFI